MLELAFTRATSASWLLKQPDKQEPAKTRRIDTQGVILSKAKDLSEYADAVQVLLHLHYDQRIEYTLHRSDK